MKNAVDRRGRNAEAKEAGRKGKGVTQGDEQIDVLTSTLVVVGPIFLPKQPNSRCRTGSQLDRRRLNCSGVDDYGPKILILLPSSLEAMWETERSCKLY